ncbi:MAG: WD40 repeat domain-containing protein [Campylobacterota bacterium]|nr:WD40 repeat domain-containing protein [Campylobacterota bacterium]
MRATLLLFILSSYLLASPYFSKTLPQESVDLIESFECFSQEDKVVLYSNLLSLKYHLENLNNEQAILASYKEHQDLGHLVSNIERKYKLSYKFGTILEKETLLNNPKYQKLYKKYIPISNKIYHKIGSRNLNQEGRDAKATLKKLLQNPPKYSIIKSKQKGKYDLTTLKKLPSKTIPKHIYDQIESKKLTGNKKALLQRIAFLEEESIRNYDNPTQRHQITQEMLYLEACEKYYNISLYREFRYTFKRQLIDKLLTHNYHLKKSELLPKEVESYCENNITKMTLQHIKGKEPKAKKSATTIIKKAKLTNLTKYLKKYDANTTQKKYAKEYLALHKRLLSTSSLNAVPNIEALRIMRLESCLIGESTDNKFDLITTRAKDLKIEGLRKQFNHNIYKSQQWWRVTIGMKLRIEDNNINELLSFFDWNATTFKLKTPQKKRQKSAYSQADIRNEIFKLSDILKYYAGVYHDKPSHNLSNQVAIKEGLISKKMIESDGNIKTYFGKNFTIGSTSEGGITLNYSDIPKGKECLDFVSSGNLRHNIYFNSDSYEGLDYILINDQKIKIKHFVHAYAKRLCDAQELNRVSFVRQTPIKKYKYQYDKPLESAFGNLKKEKVVNKYGRHHPSTAFVANSNTFLLSGSKAILYNLKTNQNQKLPRHFENLYHATLSQDKSHFVANRYDKLYIYNVDENYMVRSMLFKNIKGKIINFLPSTNTLFLLTKNNIDLFDVKKERVTQNITPHFMKQQPIFGKKNEVTSLIALAPNRLYIASNKNAIEIWSLKGKYIDSIQESQISRIHFMQKHPYRKDTLVIVHNDSKVSLYNTQSKKITQTYQADDRIRNIIAIDFDPHKKYMMVVSKYALYLWQLSNTQQFDIINGDEIKNALFIQEKNSLITINKNIIEWKLNE